MEIGSDFPCLAAFGAVGHGMFALFMVIVSYSSFILKTAVGREKAVQAIDVQRECTNYVVTFWVMSRFVHFLGASRDCADFRDPTAVFRIMHE